MKKQNGSSVLYHFVEGIRASWRNRLVNTGAVGLLIACLLFTGIFAIIVLNMNAMTEDLGSKNKIRVFMDETSTDEDVVAVQKSILEIDGVETITFVSKESALESLRGEFGDLLDGLENDNPLRDGFDVQLSSQSNMQSVVDTLDVIKGVAKVSYQGEVAAKLVEVRSFILLGGLALCAVFVIISVLIVANAVRISLYTRHREIKIMKIIGATNRFVRAPFVFEGQLLGIIGACISFALMWAFYEKLFMPGINQLGFITAIPFRSIALYWAAAYLAAGVFMGVFGSSIAINRYLKQ